MEYNGGMQDFLISLAAKIQDKYFPEYLAWLNVQLSGHSQFGILSAVGFVTMLLLVMYFWIKSRE